MGGAFGAVGADLGCGAFNPAGLAVYRKGDLNFGAGLRLSSNTGSIYGQQTRIGDAKFVYNNFGIAGAWASKRDPDSRHVLAFSNTQLQNFSTAVRMQGYTNSQSIAQDMLNLAQEKTLNDLNNSYEGMGYDAFLIDYDSASSKYFSYLDVHRTVKQTRDLVTTGRVNELNFSYAYTYKDKFYLGASLGFPQVDYSSTMTHTEEDDRDSMRVTLFPDQTYTTTYTQDLPFVYASKLGFNSATYEEYFKTSGSGVNFKIGGIMRVNDFFRLGAYYHTPTLYRLTDAYQNSLDVSFDKDKTHPASVTYPENGGTFNYRVITPGKISVNTAFIFTKKAVLSLDYEAVDYRKGSLASTNVADFAAVNNTIERKYKSGHNVRAGFEYNLEPFKLRAGYSMNGSPFGDVFAGEFVRNTISFGFGYHSPSNFYIDAVWSQTFYNENYYLFTTMDTMARLSYRMTTVGVTVGIKF